MHPCCGLLVHIMEVLYPYYVKNIGSEFTNVSVKKISQVSLLLFLSFNLLKSLLERFYNAFQDTAR